VCALLGMGVAFPRFISMITFEPVAQITNTYAQIVLQATPEQISEDVPYVPRHMADDGMFRPELRDKILDIMRTQVKQFQLMINLALTVMDNAFTLRDIASIGGLLKHILMFIMGAYLVYAFFRLFFRFCFYFVDVIVNLAIFAFFFPFMMITFVMQRAEGAADWVKKMGDAFGSNIKNVFNSITALAVAVLTYTVIMAIVAKFFAMDSGNEIMRHILDGTISKADFSNHNLTSLTLTGCVILGYFLNYLQKQIPEMTKEIWKAIGVDPAAPMGEEVGKVVEGAVKGAIDNLKARANILMSKKDEKKEGDKEPKTES